MGTFYDADKDLLRIRLSSAAIASERELPGRYVKFGYSLDQSLVEIVLAHAGECGLVPIREARKTRLSDSWKAFELLVREYTWTARLATTALVAVALLNIFKDMPCWYDPVCLPKPWVDAFASDGSLTLLTLLIAFCVAIHLKLRQTKGLLDGDDHYSIGRALAYGYFANFLLGALLVVKSENAKRNRPPDNPLKLYVVFPLHIGEMDRFRNTVEKELRVVTKTVDIEGLFGPSNQVLKRKILVIAQTAGHGNTDDLFIDFPTTLYTVQDYFESWNRWLDDGNGRRNAPEVVRELQQKQIEEFFWFLRDISMTTIGVEAARRLGINLSVDELSQLFKTHFERIEPAEMIARIQMGTRLG